MQPTIDPIFLILNLLSDKNYYSKDDIELEDITGSGTGFFISDSSIFLSVEHVFRAENPELCESKPNRIPEDETGMYRFENFTNPYAILSDGSFYKIDKYDVFLKRGNDYDYAVGKIGISTPNFMEYEKPVDRDKEVRVEGIKDKEMEGLIRPKLASTSKDVSDISMEENVLPFSKGEYVSISDKVFFKNNIPFLRVSNKHLSFNGFDDLKYDGDWFPANLQGMSGSPVIRVSDNKVIGMLKGEISDGSKARLYYEIDDEIIKVIDFIKNS